MVMLRNFPVFIKNVVYVVLTFINSLLLASLRHFGYTLASIYMYFF